MNDIIKYVKGNSLSKVLFHISLLILAVFSMFFIPFGWKISLAIRQYFAKKVKEQEWEEKKKAIGLLMGSLVAHKEKQEKEKRLKAFTFATIGTVVALVAILKFLKLPLNPKTKDEKDAPPNTEFL